MFEDGALQVAGDARGDAGGDHIDDPEMRPATPDFRCGVVIAHTHPFGPFVREIGPCGKGDAQALVEIKPILPREHGRDEQAANIINRPMAINAVDCAQAYHMADGFGRGETWDGWGGGHGGIVDAEIG